MMCTFLHRNFSLVHFDFLENERNRISLPLAFLFCLSPFVMAMGEKRALSGQEGDLISR